MQKKSTGGRCIRCNRLYRKLTNGLCRHCHRSAAYSLDRCANCGTQTDVIALIGDEWVCSECQIPAFLRSPAAAEKPQIQVSIPPPSPVSSIPVLPKRNGYHPSLAARIVVGIRRIRRRFFTR